ncbi:MAG: hypothetical protein NVS4B8_25870 [Herpetosiphon sp.]
MEIDNQIRNDVPLHDDSHGRLAYDTLNLATGHDTGENTYGT